MKPRTPDVNKELLRQATGSLYLITDPRSDIFLKRSENMKKHANNYLENWNT
ncbi:hypothetical protein [Cyanophage S-TIM54]|nr:hypothetical protein [Cyanophage S-TIM54]